MGIGLGGSKGCTINIARDLGPRLAHFISPVPNKGDSDWQYYRTYMWIYSFSIYL